VGQRARGSELHQPAARRATLLHLARQELLHVAFVLPRRQLRERRGDRRLGDVDGAPDQDDFLGRFDDPQPFGHGRAVHELPARQLVRQRQIHVVTGGGLERDHAVAAWPELPHHALEELVRVRLLLPAPRIRYSAVLLDALHLECGTHHDRLPGGGDDDGDQALAAAGVVAREVLVVGAGRGDEAIELAAGWVGPGAPRAAGGRAPGPGGVLGPFRVSGFGFAGGGGGGPQPPNPTRKFSRAPRPTDP